ncbi:DUF359 domain-containing protein [Candidatus Micrarchaeota archaeon]|nr:DUF359 domain-containing protein [Candidatus Micrarchaeota archaeon]
MTRIGPKTREFLKKPLGKLYKNIKSAKGQNQFTKKRIIAIGDIVTLRLLGSRIVPHVAVFDYQTKRKKLTKNLIGKIKKIFPKARKYANAAGTVSNRLIKDAKKIMKRGGGILVKGEEDLTALAFILSGRSGDRVIYGQPNKGIVIVSPNKIKRKIRRLLGL